MMIGLKIESKENNLKIKQWQDMSENENVQIQDFDMTIFLVKLKESE